MVTATSVWNCTFSFLNVLCYDTEQVSSSLLVTPDVIHNVSSLRLLARAVGIPLDDNFQLDTPMLDDGCLCKVSNENDNFILNGCFLFL